MQLVNRLGKNSVLFGLICWILGPANLKSEENWPRFRGENGTGISRQDGFPVSWSQADYEWVVDLHGKGHSSPVIWGKRLFVTVGTEAGGRILRCLNAETGQELWSQELGLEANHLHLKNSYASGTPAVDGERVYCTFADEKQYLVLAYTLEGDLVWSADLGSFTSQHGQGVSPIVAGELVIVPNDQMGPSTVAALDRKTGKIVWNSSRTFRRTSYSTPIIYHDPTGRDQVICVSGATGVTGLDLNTGRQLWISGQMPLRTVASPVMGHGLVIASCGSGGKGKYLVAVDPTGEGNVSETHIRYERKRILPYVPTPIVRGEQLFLWTDDGIVCCLDMKTGKDIWQKRVGGKFSGSPVLIGDKLYCISEAGEVVVLAIEPEAKILGRSPLGDESYATPAVANGRLYLRGFHSLACLKSLAKPKDSTR